MARVKKKQLYIVVLHHEYGVTVNLVRCDHFPIESEVVNSCDLFFEEEKGEWIGIFPLDKVVEIK